MPTECKACKHETRESAHAKEVAALKVKIEKLQSRLAAQESRAVGAEYDRDRMRKALENEFSYPCPLEVPEALMAAVFWRVVLQEKALGQDFYINEELIKRVAGHTLAVVAERRAIAGLVGAKEAE